MSAMTAIDQLRSACVYAQVEQGARRATAFKFGDWFVKHWPNDDEAAAWAAWKGARA